MAISKFIENTYDKNMYDYFPFNMSGIYHQSI